jgi:rod shape-determining protein MreC
MSRITNLFARHWRNIHFAIIILLSAGFIGFPSVLNSTFNQVIFSVFYYPFSSTRTAVAELTDVAEKNEELRQELTEASLMLSMYEEASRENSRLRSVLGFDPPPEYSLLPAEVMSVSGDYMPIAAVINKGAEDSIYVDQPVINRQGLIGRVSSVTTDFATVQLLTDPSNRVAARLAASREMGIIKYTTSEGMLLDNFPIQGTILVGDTVLSSGLGGVYPAGLKVGIVTEVSRPELQPFCDIRVAPLVNFYSIDELFILRMGKQ